MAKAGARGHPARDGAGARCRAEEEDAAGAGDAAVPGAAARARRASGGARAAKKTHPVHLRTKAAIFAFIGQERERFGVARLCRLFGVTRAGFYAWRRRPVSAHARQDRVLLDEMRVIFERSDRTYGSPRLYRALVRRGYAVSHRRVERLMRQAQWRARVVRVYRRTAGTHRWFAQHPNRVRAQVTTAPNQIWAAT